MEVHDPSGGLRGGPGHMPALDDEQKAAIVRELESILTSHVFKTSERCKQFLSYVVKHSLEGHHEPLKERTIGVDLFHRPPNYPTGDDPVVRVKATEVRRRLAQYYQEESNSPEVRIELPVGSYTPEYRWSQAGTPAPLPQVVRPPSRKHSRLLVAAASVIVALVIVVLALVVGSRRRAPPVSLAEPSSGQRGAVAGGPEVRILAGYTKDKYIDRRGKVWFGDRYYTGGEAVTIPSTFIARTQDPLLFQNYRSGEFSYDVPLRPGTYELRLYFCETHFGPGTLEGGGESSRIFVIEINNNLLPDLFDPISAAGGSFTAYVRVFKDVHPAPDGYLHLKFKKSRDVPLLNALEITPGEPGRLLPIRIVAQENSFTDQNGRVWDPDSYFSGGRLARHKGPVQGTQDPDLYVGERFGNFNYAIPVAPGKYTVKLYFAETYFGKQNSDPAGVGARVFDVYGNGVALLRNFDIFKEAGGENRALVKTFTGLEPTHGGLITLSFVPVNNYACLNAIEVLAESSENLRAEY